MRRATACPRLVGTGIKSSANGVNRHGSCQADIDASLLPNLGKTQQIAHNRLAPPIFVGTIGMQSVPATAGRDIDERERKVVAAEKPSEDVGGDGLPFGITARAPRRQAGGNRRRRFDRLLIESTRGFPEFAETGRT